MKTSRIRAASLEIGNSNISSGDQFRFRNASRRTPEAILPCVSYAIVMPKQRPRLCWLPHQRCALETQLVMREIVTDSSGRDRIVVELW